MKLGLGIKSMLKPGQQQKIFRIQTILFKREKQIFKFQNHVI